MTNQQDSSYIDMTDFGPLVGKKTSIVELSFPFLSVQGRSRREGKVYYMRGALCIRREWVGPFNPNTPLQQERREDFGTPRKAWSTVPTEEQREAWIGYGQQKLWPGEKWKSPRLAGQNAFASVHMYRLALGLGYLADAPKEGPPAAVLSISQEAAQSAESFAFRVEHGMQEPRGYLLVKLTKAMPSLRRKPRENELVWATGEAQTSFLPLQASGAVYTIPRARVAVENGQRYGVEMTLVSADGVAGEKRMADFVKVVQEAGAAPLYSPHTAEKAASGAEVRSAGSSARALRRENAESASAGPLPLFSSAVLRLCMKNPGRPAAQKHQRAEQDLVDRPPT